MSDSSLRITPEDRSLRSRLVEKLREAILSGKFLPGTRLTDRELCEMFDVSRALIREAIQHLSAEQLIINVPHRGPVVASIDRKEAEEIYAVRVMLEAMAGAGFAKEANDQQRAQLEAAAALLRNREVQVSGDALIRAKNQFYSVLLEGCGNRVVARMLVLLNNRITLLRRLSLSRPGRLHETIREVDAIMDAIRRKDPEAAFSACQAHVQRAAKVAVHQLAESSLDKGEDHE